MNLFYKESQSKRKKIIFFCGRGGGGAGVSGVGSGDRGGASK